MTAGQLHLTVIAGNIEATDIEPSDSIGQQIRMPGSGVLIYITPDTARQWIGVLEPIATKEENA